MDELSRHEVESGDYVSRYLRGGLSQAELERFEEHCLMHPETVSDVRAERALSLGLRKAFAQPEDSAMSGWRLFEIAASLAVISILCVWAANLVGRPGPTALYASLPVQSPVATLSGPFQVVRQRSTGVLEITLPRDSRMASFNIWLAEAPKAGQVRVTLYEVGDGGAIERGRLPAAPVNDDGEVSVVVDLQSISSRRLRFEVQPRHEQEIEVFDIRISQNP